MHWLVYDILAFLGGLKEDAGEGVGWTTGQNSDGDTTYLPFPGTDPRRARFEMFASRSPTGLDRPASWEDIADILEKQDAFGPFGFEAFDASLPALLGMSE